jgi:hypothetical protein
MRPGPTLLTLVVIMGALVATASVVGLILRRLMRTGGDPRWAAAITVLGAAVFTVIAVAALLLVPHLESMLRS